MQQMAILQLNRPTYIDSVVTGGQIIHICFMSLTDKNVIIHVPAKEVLGCATYIS